MRYEMIYDICVLCCVSCFEVEPKAYRTTPPESCPVPSLPSLEILLCYVPFVHPHLLLRKNNKNNNNNIIKETDSTHILINHIQHYHHYN